MLALRLIFYGLVALVPSINGEGAAVLFPAADHVIDELGCRVPVHHPRIFRVRYQCSEGGTECKCGSYPCLEDLNLNNPTYIEPELNSLGMTKVEGRRAAANGADLIFPLDDQRAEDISWIPSLSRLSFGSQDIRPECLVHPNECNIGLMVRTWAGNVETCHLAHPSEMTFSKKDGKYDCGKHGPIMAYRFLELGGSPASSDVVQAVADAFAITFKDIKTPSISLYIEPGAVRKRVEFGEDRTLTLLFANIPAEEHESNSSRCYDRGVDRHFVAYYDLGMADPASLASLPLPQATHEAAGGPLVDMSCETEVSLLDDKLVAEFRRSHDPVMKDSEKACPKIKPHTLEVCSTATFFAEALPSLRSRPPAALSEEGPLSIDFTAKASPDQARPIRPKSSSARSTPSSTNPSSTLTSSTGTTPP